VDLQNNFTTGDNRNANNHQQTHYSINTARPWSPVQPSLKVPPLLKEVVEVVAVVEQAKKAKTPTRMIRSGG
jgi:hypothetical protein